MSQAYLDWDGKDAADLPGIGRYGKDSYDIFVRLHDKKHWQVLDKELKNYLKWLDGGTPAGGSASYPHEYEGETEQD